MSELHKALLGQARGCAALGSDFYSSLLERAVQDPASLEGLFSAWDGKPVEAHFADATPLRLLGALHDLVLSGEEPELTRTFPPAGDGAAAWRAAGPVIAR